MNIRQARKLQRFDRFRKPSANGHDAGWRVYMVTLAYPEGFSAGDQHGYFVRVHWDDESARGWLKDAEQIDPLEAPGRAVPPLTTEGPTDAQVGPKFAPNYEARIREIREGNAGPLQPLGLVEYLIARCDRLETAEAARSPGYVPYSEADVCWCQPFDGPTHPECPMHGLAKGGRQ